MKPRAIAEILGVLLCLALVGQARCQGERIGKAKSALAEERRQSAMHQRAAKSLLQRANSLDAELKAQTKLLASAKSDAGKSRTRYVTLRDTLTISDTSEVRAVIGAADKALATADSVIQVQGEIIGLQGQQIVALRSVVSVQDSTIASLNKQIRLAVKANKSSRMDRLAKAATWTAVGAVVGYGLAR